MGTPPPGTADHLRFDGEDFAERYLAGRLTPEEAAAFEVHYLDCEACLDRLDLARRLRDGLSQITGPVAGEERRAVPAAGLSDALTRLGRSRQLGLALAAVLVVALLPAGLLWREVGRLRSDLAAAERRAAPPPAAADPLAAELAEARRELAEQRGRLDTLQAGLEQAEKAVAERDRLAAQLTDLLRPQADLQLMELSPERGGPDPGADDPSVRVTLTDATEWVLLSLDVGGLERAAKYHATLRRGGARLWQGTLTPDAHGNLILGLPSPILAAGIHTVEVRIGEEDTAPAVQFHLEVRRR